MRQRLIHPFPQDVYYMYNIEQDFMHTWNETETQPIKFIKGLDFEQVDNSAEWNNPDHGLRGTLTWDSYVGLLRGNW